MDEYAQILSATLRAESTDQDKRALKRAKDHVEKIGKTVSVRINSKTIVCVPADKTDRIQQYQARFQ